MDQKRGFTLVELLTVISIIAILSAVFLPVAVASRGMAYQMVASQAIGQLGTAATMYAADHDETMPLAMYETGDGMQAWFGRRNPDHTNRPQFGLLASYTGRRMLKDPIYVSKPYFGDGSGFGYNWAYLGSDFGVVGNYDGFPNCVNAAKLSEISDPSHVVMFATSGRYFASWEPGGDGQVYDLGVVDAPQFWNGNPNVDFRHNGVRVIDSANRSVASKGLAPISFCDGRVTVKHQTELTDSNFERAAKSSS